MHATPLAASLLGHAALLAALAGGAALTADGPAGGPGFITVGRAPDLPASGGQRLVLDAPDTEATPVSGDAGDAVALDTLDPAFRPYLLGVKRRIRDRWGDPGAGGGGAAQGSLLVEFTLTRSGRLAAAAVRVPSGIPGLDRAAVEALARAAPFDPLPAAIPGESLRIRARFIYD